MLLNSNNFYRKCLQTIHTCQNTEQLKYAKNYSYLLVDKYSTSKSIAYMMVDSDLRLRKGRLGRKATYIELLDEFIEEMPTSEIESITNYINKVTIGV